MVVGAGIFKSPALVAENAGTAFAIYGVWILGGLISLIGALCYGELSTAYPSTGGDYHFLSLAYGRRVGFLFAWARLAVINTGSIALLGFVIGDYLNRVWDLGPQGPPLYAIAAVIGVTLLNLRNKAKVVATDYALISLEIVGLLVLGVAAIWLVVTGIPPKTLGNGNPQGLSGIGYAMVFVLLAFGGWSEMATLSAEVKDQKRGMVRALISAVIIITLLYILVSWSLMRGLGIEGLATSSAPAADLMEQAFGAKAGVVLAIAVAAAAITSINSTIIVGARTTFAAAQNEKPLAWLGLWDGARDIPRNAILVQSAIALGLIVFGALYDGFSTLVDYTAPVYWLFLMGSGFAVIVLRRKLPNVERPYLVPFYPLLPILFVASSAAMLWSSLNYVKTGAWFGLGVLSVGLMISLVFIWLQKR